MSQITIQASNIKCGGCVSTVEKGLKDFSGITDISVDIESNIVTLDGDIMDQSAIENKLSDLGYPVVKN